jgi:hypothetical protein
MSICRGSRWFGLPNFFLVTARTGGATDRFEVVPLPTGADAGSFLRLPQSPPTIVPSVAPAPERSARQGARVLPGARSEGECRGHWELRGCSLFFGHRRHTGLCAWPSRVPIGCVLGLADLAVKLSSGENDVGGDIKPNQQRRHRA